MFTKGHHVDWNDNNTQTFSVDVTDANKPKPFQLVQVDPGAPATDDGTEWEHRCKVFDGTMPLLGVARIAHDDDAVTVKLQGKDGTMKVMAGPGIQCGDYVKADPSGTGKVITGTAAENCGYKLTKGISGDEDIIEIIDYRPIA